MNENTPQPSFELPAPQSVEIGESEQKTPERPAAMPETSGNKPLAQAIPPAVAPSSMPVLGQPIASNPAPAKAPTTVAADPLIADDADLIEKEWVQKAKQIVAATREDPHTQTREMNRFKADYMKKRYNKDLKLEEN